MKTPPPHFFLFLILLQIQNIHVFPIEYNQNYLKSKSMAWNQSRCGLGKKVACWRRFYHCPAEDEFLHFTSHLNSISDQVFRIKTAISL